jgi:hypothetical protein
MAIADHLHLDVPGRLDVALDVQAVVAKGDARALSTRGERTRQAFRLLHQLHAHTAAATSCFDQHGIADALGLERSLREIGHDFVAARCDTHAGLQRQRFAANLVAEQLERFDAGADERQAGRFDRARKGWVLTQQAVARVNGLRAGGLGGFDDRALVQVRRLDGRWAHTNSFVAALFVQALFLGLAVDCDAADTQALAGARDANCDRATISDKHFLEHFVREPTCRVRAWKGALDRVARGYAFSAGVGSATHRRGTERLAGRSVLRTSGQALCAAHVARIEARGGGAFAVGV